MKSKTSKVAIGSDQIDPKFLDGRLKIDNVPFTPQHPNFKVLRTVDGRVTVPLGEITTEVPESKDEVIALLEAQPTMVVDTLSTQLITNAMNAYRKSFTKEGDAAIKAANRERTRRWLFTPDGQRFGAEYCAIPANDSKAINAWLDAKFEEFGDDMPE